MRLQYLLTQDLHSPSGLGRFFPLAREMARLGHDVDLVALHSDYEHLEQHVRVEDGVQVRYIAPMHIRKEGNQKIYYSTPQLLSVVARATWRMGKEALGGRADIIHICKPHPMNSIAGILAKTLHHQTLFLDCDDYEAASGRFSKRWQFELVGIFERTIPRYVSLVTTHTETMRRHLMDWGVPEERILYLPNGVDRTRFENITPGQIERLRERWGLGSKKVVAYIGSLSLPSHPVDFLLKAFARLHSQAPDSVLMIVGGGEDLEAMRTLAEKLGISNATLFCGRVPPDEAPLYYRLANVSVDPVYDDEAARCRSPLKLFESWLAGAPFLSSDVGDRRLLLGEPAAGLLTEAGNPEAMAQGMLRILTDLEFQAELRRRGFERVKDYTWDVVAPRLETVYRAWYNKKLV